VTATLGNSVPRDWVRASRQAQTTCELCSALETMCSGWVKQYRTLTEERKSLLMEGRCPTADLNQAIACAESELRAVLRRLAEHSACHTPTIF
jgi:hypothetical protein